MALKEFGQLNLGEAPPAGGSRSVACFEKLKQIGVGGFGDVYKAREIETGEIVALKRIRMHNYREGFPYSAVREIRILKKLQHENIIRLREIVISTGGDVDDEGDTVLDNNIYKGAVYLVFEFMDHDLTGLIAHAGSSFTVPQIKCYMKQLLDGLHYCHRNLVLHRDLKGQNLLINNEGILKLADFGLARPLLRDHSGDLTNPVATLWYRPPELLLGETKYRGAVDMWSVGCVFGEILCGEAILQGDTELDQLNKIFLLCGSPDEINWPGVARLPLYSKLQFNPQIRSVTEVFMQFDPLAVKLLEKMLVLDPAKRISVTDALADEYFSTDPLPCDPNSLPPYESSFSMGIKKKTDPTQPQKDEAEPPQKDEAEPPKKDEAEPQKLD